jgi:hypothetical protein
MLIDGIRQALEEIRTLAQEGNTERVLDVADRTLHELSGEKMLTTTEAAHLLGLGSVNTLKLLVQRFQLRYEKRGNRMMIPLSEVQRIQESTVVRGLRASEQAHAEIADLGPENGLTDEELAQLEQTRPGRLPWKCQDNRVETNVSE